MNKLSARSDGSKIPKIFSMYLDTQNMNDPIENTWKDQFFQNTLVCTNKNWRNNPFQGCSCQRSTFFQVHFLTNQKSKTSENEKVLESLKK